jgi:chemotaxis protein CheX
MKSITKPSSNAVQPFDPHWKNIFECAALEVFEMMLGTRFELEASPTDHPRGEQTAMVGMAGALRGITTIQCSRAIAAKCASLMLGGDAASTPSTASDALGELCNMVAGNFKAKVSTLADHCMLSVPTVITGEDYSMETAQPTERIVAALIHQGDRVWVTLTVHT